MIKRYLILFHIILINFFVFAQDKNLEELMQCDDYISASLVVVSPGNKIYSAGGHLALRMTCPIQDVDYIYEFDAIIDKDESLILRYLNGNLEGSYVRLFATDFYNKIRAENRKSVDYPLNLTPLQEVRLWSYVDDEVDGRTRYAFIPESDNCCSMLLTIVEKSIRPGAFSNHDNFNLSKTAGRKYIEDIFGFSPWTGLLWNLLIGTDLDKPAYAINLLYPEIIGSTLSSIVNPDNGGMLTEENTCSGELFKNTGESVLSPGILFLTIFIMSICLTIFNLRGHLRKVSLIFDILLLITSTVIGSVLWYMFLASIIRNDIHFNMLLFIFNPVPILLSFIRNKKVWRIYSLAIAAISSLYLLGIYFIPQIQVYGLWLLIAAILARSICYYNMTRPDKNQIKTKNYNHMRKVKSFGLLAALVMTLCSIQTSRAGETSYYKNLSFTVRNPETAKGRVYLTPYNATDSTYCTVSEDPKMAKVEGNFSNTGKDFRVNMFALPADGYVLDCLTTPNAYSNGNYRSECVGNPSGYPLSSMYLILDQDTVTNCTKVRPQQGSYMKPVNYQELYAVFVPAKKMSVRNTVAGNVSSAVKAGRYGEAANDLVVTGPLNHADLKYLNKLSNEKGLIRLDLSGASFTVVPDSAFYKSGLYELKLPSDIKVVGNYAFANSIGLKPVILPKDITKGEETISGCLLMNLLGVKETSTLSDEDLYWLFPYLFF